MKNKTKIPLEQIFPIEFIQDHKTVTKNGAISLGFELVGMPFSESIAEDGYLSAHFLFHAALETLPSGTYLHKMDIFYFDSFKVERGEETYFTKRKLNHYHFRPILKQKSYLFVGKLENQHPPNSAQTFFSLKKRRYSQLLFGLEEKLNHIEKLGDQIYSALHTLPGIQLKRMQNENLIEFYTQYLNLDFDGSNSNPKSLYKPIINQSKACLVGNEYLNIISMIGQGSEVSSSDLQKNGIHGPFIEPILSSLPFPHIVNQCILISDTEKELNKLDGMRNLVNAFTGYKDQAGELHELGLGELSKEIRQTGGGLVRFYLNVMVSDSDLGLQNQKIDFVRTQFSSLNGLKAMVENFDTCNLFFSMIGGNLSENFRWILMPAKNAACYFHFTGPFKGDSRGILLCNRKREPIHLNFWNDALENKNKIVVGPSGSGKSFTINTLITQHYADKEEVIIIDIGGSYKGLFKALRGKYIEYQLSGSLHFNPFLIHKNTEGNFIPNQEKINFLVTLMIVIWKGENYIVSKTEKALLARLVKEFYRILPENHLSFIPNMDSFYHFLNSIFSKNLISEEFQNDLTYLDIKSLLIVLHDFSHQGSFPRLLNSKDLDLLSEYPLICFDLQGIKEDVTLFPIVSLLIIELILDKIRQFPKHRKNIYMDEAWSMLKEALGEFVMNMFRTIRKSNGAITIITQGIDEIEKSPVGKAILQNSATKIILDHSSATQFFPLLQVSLGLTEHELGLLKSLGKNEMEGWREIFVKFGNEAYVLVIEPSPEEKIAFDSKIETRMLLEKYLDRYDSNLELAIDQINEERRGHAAFK